jgi:hypothetical protein
MRDKTYEAMTLAALALAEVVVKLTPLTLDQLRIKNRKEPAAPY